MTALLLPILILIRGGGVILGRLSCGKSWLRIWLIVTRRLSPPLLVLHGVLDRVKDKVSIKVAKVDKFLEHKLKGIDSLFALHTADVEGPFRFSTTDGRRVDHVVHLVGDILTLRVHVAVFVNDLGSLLIFLFLEEVLCGQNESKGVNVSPNYRHFDEVARPAKASFHSWLGPPGVLLADQLGNTLVDLL